MYSDVVYSISYFVNEENIIFRIRFDKLQETSEDLILENNKDIRENKIKFIPW